MTTFDRSWPVLIDQVEQGLGLGAPPRDQILRQAEPIGDSLGIGALESMQANDVLPPLVQPSTREWKFVRGVWCSQLTCRRKIAGRMTAPRSPRQRLAGEPKKNINASELGQWPLEVSVFATAPLLSGSILAKWKELWTGEAVRLAPDFVPSWRGLLPYDPVRDIESVSGQDLDGSELAAWRSGARGCGSRGGWG